MSRRRATEPEQRVSLKLRGAEPIGWLYELRLRAGKDGQLASVSSTIRQALELASQSLMPAKLPVPAQEPSE